MNRKTLSPLLVLLAIVALGYAIYRSTAVRTTMVVNNQQTIYGEPQHGLLLGLCVFAGMCLVAAALIADKDVIAVRDERTEGSRRILS